MEQIYQGFTSVWAVDFEFIAHPGERPDVVCLSAQEVRSGRKLLLWRDQLGSEPPYPGGPDSLFVAYYASAELGCHRSLGSPQPARVLDLFAEFRKLTNGKSLMKAGLVDALHWFGLDSIEVAEKEEMRNLVLRGGPWTADEKQSILKYCESDTTALLRLLPRVLAGITDPEDLITAITLRGRYMSAVSGMEYYGTPIDTDALGRILSGWEGLKEGLVAEVDSEYGVYEGTTFKADKFEQYLIRNDIAWPTIESGQLDLSKEAFRDMSHIYPALNNLKELRHSLSELRLNDLAVGRDGFNRCMLSPFRSITGRNQPSNAKFIFGPSTWIRGLIKPKQGWAIAYIDWSQQEFGIAAALSGDKRMMEAYLSGDPYLEFAIQAGAAPKSATKKTHKEIRDQYKQCVLGVQYGMGEESLSHRIKAPAIVARDLLRRHREVYSKFWSWSDNQLDWSIQEGFQTTGLGWVVHIDALRHGRVGEGRSPRSIRNYPMQAGGANMMQLASIMGIEDGIQICAPVHDALLITAPLHDIEDHVRRMQEHMESASRLILRDFPLRSDANIVRYPDRYMDERGQSFWETVMRRLPAQ